jgi:hypothetical protein
VIASLEVRIVPPAPTAAKAEPYTTPYKVFEVPEVMEAQVDPPSMDRTTVPPAPTATKTWEPSGNEPDANSTP